MKSIVPEECSFQGNLQIKPQSDVAGTWVIILSEIRTVPAGGSWWESHQRDLNIEWCVYGGLSHRDGICPFSVPAGACVSSWHLAQEHINHSKPGRMGLNLKGVWALLPPGRKGLFAKEVGAITDTVQSRSRASKEFKTVQIQLQSIISPQEGCLHVLIPGRVDTSPSLD